MQKIIYILVILLFTPNMLWSQNLSGVWRVAYTSSFGGMEIGDNSDLTDTTTYFRISDGVIIFDKKNVVIHNFKTKSIKRKIKPTKRNEVILKFRKHKFSIVSESSDSIVLRSLDNPVEYAVLFPLKVEGAIHLSDSNFKNTIWEIDSDSSFYDGMQLHFSDSNSLYLTARHENYGHTNWGEWKLHRSGDYQVLSILDRNNLNEYIFYILSQSKEQIMTSLVMGDWSETPQHVKLILNKKQELSEGELYHIESSLKGEWNFKEFANQLDTAIYTDIGNIDFRINFTDNENCLLENEIQNHKGDVIFEKNQKGTWNLSKTGNYISLDFNEGWSKILSIYTLDSDEVTFDMDYQVKDHFYVDTRIRMTKKKYP